jgi:hypothetical protein
MEHSSKDYVDMQVLNRLQSEPSGDLRFNAQCHYIQTMLGDPGLYETAWNEAGQIVEKWPESIGLRELDNYRRILAGNIAVLRIGSTVGAKGPTETEIAKWLREAAELQTKWCDVESAMEFNPLDMFRTAIRMLVREKKFIFSAPRREGEQSNPAPSHDTLGPITFQELGWKATPPEVGETENVIIPGTEKPFPMADNSAGTFVGYVAGQSRGKPPKFERQLRFTVAEFDNLYLDVERWLRKDGKTFPPKEDVLKLLTEESVRNDTQINDGGGKRRVIQLNADWVFRKNEE